MGAAVFVNIVGSIFAIVGIVLYAIHLGRISVSRMCGSYSSQSSNCFELADIAQVSMLLKDKAGFMLYVSYCEQLP